MKKIIALFFCAAALTFAQPADSAQVTPTQTTPDVNAELAMRDSIMAAHDSTCSVEKNALRTELEVEQAKSANWEQSYNTIKRDNEVCAQALSVSIDVQEKNKEKMEDEKRMSAMSTGGSFLGGLGVGMLIMWLILD